MSDYKTSLLINRQLPEFIRDEHPKFIAFLEAYYEFLEQKQGIQLNDLTSEAKRLRFISNVDVSLDEFEKNFFNTYASLVPQDVSVDKEFLIKNILPLYLSKGSEASFKLLFRMLFGKEVGVSYPKDKILRASDGKWDIENVLRVDTLIKTFYYGDGVTKEFLLSQQVDQNTILVYVDGVLQTGGYYVRKESKKIVFLSAPASNSKIEVAYNSFDTSLLINRKLIGSLSEASAVIEKIDQRTIAADNYFQFYINNKTLNGSFTNGEIVVSDILSSNNKINVEFRTLSDIKSITIIDGGAKYNVGDPVGIRGTSNVKVSATAVVEKIVVGTIDTINVVYSGAGFQVSNNVEAVGITQEFFNASVISVDTSGTKSPNTLTFFTDLITDIDIANVTIGAANYGFPSSNVTENANSVIAQALTSTTINVGPVSAVLVTQSAIEGVPALDIVPSIVKGNVRVNDLGILGRIDIVDGGLNYNVGEYLVFTNQPKDYSGYGANAQVAAVAANGAITRIRINDGGAGYYSDLPSVTVSSPTGTNANLVVTSIMGDNETLLGLLAKDEFGNTVQLGKILKIRVITPGQGYDTLPVIDLSKSGNGLATANVQLQNSYVTLPGKWTTTDSLLSSEDRRLEGRNYYINFSYVLSSKVEFSKYKTIFKQLIQPAGFKQYGEYDIEKDIQANVPASFSVSIANTISGTVNVNNSIYVIGTNTKFNIANTRGILTIGTKVAVGSNTRYINAIYSNTVFTVNSAFSITSNDQTLIIL